MRSDQSSRRDFLKTALAVGAVVSGGPRILAAEGFAPLWNGMTLDDWVVDTPSVWSVHDGTIIGKSPGLSYNEFLRTRKTYSDFIFKGSLRLIDGQGNSGFQFRSKAVPNSHEDYGYQADAGLRYWGSLYDESRRRKTLAWASDAFLDKLDPKAWHAYVVTARGPHIQIETDGVKTVDYTETEPGIEQTGHIALQVHAQQTPVEMQFKDLWIKVL
ncbi:MAG TPA: family 16 glycoside hydrolase [Bryobacteraceae bacterium]|nr:family 16 glycoside hydrolase [Bryobacteraceae bacterium]